MFQENMGGEKRYILLEWTAAGTNEFIFCFFNEKHKESAVLL